MSTEAKELMDALVRCAQEETADLLIEISRKLTEQLELVGLALDTVDTALTQVNASVDAIGRLGQQLKLKAVVKTMVEQTSTERRPS